MKTHFKNHFFVLLPILILYSYLYTINSYSLTSNRTSNNDHSITLQLKKKILEEHIEEKIMISVKNGIVKLSGTINSETAANNIIEYTESINNVKEVDTENLRIKNSGQPFTDAFITAKIKGQFIKEKIFGTHDIASLKISVETKNGLVYLAGEADNQKQIDTAIKIAKATENVKNVICTIKISTKK